jgi:hypothetical protein
MDGARTPEELEALLEDALVVRDGAALAALFEAGAILVAGTGPPARGGALARAALALWAGERTYVADPRRVVQARDLALVAAEGGIHVARRGRDGTWRYAMVVVSRDDTTAQEDQSCTTQHGHRP